MGEEIQNSERCGARANCRHKTQKPTSTFNYSTSIPCQGWNSSPTPQFKCLDVALLELAVQPIISNYAKKMFLVCHVYKNNVVQDILRLNGIEWNAAGMAGCDSKWLTTQRRSKQQSRTPRVDARPHAVTRRFFCHCCSVRSTGMISSSFLHFCT